MARLAAVSPATVSRCLNHPELVSPATRRSVEAAIRKSGYIRNRAAQAIHGRRSGTIAIVVPTITHSIFAEAVQAFSDVVTENAFSLFVASHGYDLDMEYSVVRKLLEHRVDGIALTGGDHQEAVYDVLRRQQVPTVSLWSYAEGAPIASVGADNAEVGRRAAEHLLLLGHRRIATIFPDVTDNDRARFRRSEAFKVLTEAGAMPRDDWNLHSPYSLSRSKAACMQLLSSDDRPTALLCGNDILAQGAIYAAARLGIRVPDDLSIMGMGDFAGSAEIEPALTTIRLPARRIGRRAGEKLVDAIADGGTVAGGHEKIEIELVMRQTTALPPKG